ncbi:MAG: (Fe-S)-binding protein [Desulfotomaculaceae bacterium]|nr:(Fe-S)-binding protein [Desulfotomaculaceae bacterium]MDD4766980.1 (Fe-S)-binding protein [Desulfotomaculaceae bacterium]
MDKLKPHDMSRPPAEQLASLDHLMPLPPPYDKQDMEPGLKPVKDTWRETYCTSLDGFVGNDNLKRPGSKSEEEEFINKFLSGLDKLFARETNSGFLTPFNLAFEYCARCGVCSEACHVFQASGGKEVYRPLFRSDTLRRLYKSYKKQGRPAARFTGGSVGINAEALLRLGELAYRCNLCRRCAQTCPLGLDNSVIAREIRALFSMEMGMAPTLLHERGTVLQLKTGSSTGMNKNAFLDNIEFIEEDLYERLGKKYKFPIDKKGADILLIHNAGEFLSWPDNPAAFAILFTEAGLDWTMSSELAGYDAVNYGIWYDDAQARKISLAQRRAARELGVRRIVIGECGHAHRAAAVSSDRLAVGEDNIPRESSFPILQDIVRSGAIKFDPLRNNFPVTLHDPCNIVRSMGVVMPQRQILRALCPQFREMAPHGVNNYCCGGGGGFAVMRNMNFPEWEMKVSARMKFKQILEAFQDKIEDPTIPKYICAPCSNCKGAFRDMLNYYQATARFNVQYGGIVELMVNAMAMFDRPYFEWLEEF